MHIGVSHMEKGVEGVKEHGEASTLGVPPEFWPNKTSQELATSVPEVRTSLLALDSCECPAKQRPSRNKLSQV